MKAPFSAALWITLTCIVALMFLPLLLNSLGLDPKQGAWLQHAAGLVFAVGVPLYLIWRSFSAGRAWWQATDSSSPKVLIGAALMLITASAWLWLLFEASRDISNGGVFGFALVPLLVAAVVGANLASATASSGGSGAE